MQLLKDEMEMNMRLIGCSSVEQLNPTLVDTRGLSMHSTSVPADTLGMTVYGMSFRSYTFLFWDDI